MTSHVINSLSKSSGLSLSEKKSYNLSAKSNISAGFKRNLTHKKNGQPQYRGKVQLTNAELTLMEKAQEIMQTYKSDYDGMVKEYQKAKATAEGASKELESARESLSEAKDAERKIECTRRVFAEEWAAEEKKMEAAYAEQRKFEKVRDQHENVMIEAAEELKVAKNDSSMLESVRKEKLTAKINDFSILAKVATKNVQPTEQAWRSAKDIYNEHSVELGKIQFLAEKTKSDADTALAEKERAYEDCVQATDDLLDVMERIRMATVGADPHRPMFDLRAYEKACTTMNSVTSSAEDARRRVTLYKASSEKLKAKAATLEAEVEKKSLLQGEAKEALDEAEAAMTEMMNKQKETERIVNKLKADFEYECRRLESARNDAVSSAIMKMNKSELAFREACMSSFMANKKAKMCAASVAQAEERYNTMRVQAIQNVAISLEQCSAAEETAQKKMAKLNDIESRLESTRESVLSAEKAANEARAAQEELEAQMKRKAQMQKKYDEAKNRAERIPLTINELQMQKEEEHRYMREAMQKREELIAQKAAIENQIERTVMEQKLAEQMASGVDEKIEKEKSWAPALAEEAMQSFQAEKMVAEKKELEAQRVAKEVVQAAKKALENVQLAVQASALTHGMLASTSVEIEKARTEKARADFMEQYNDLMQKTGPKGGHNFNRSFDVTDALNVFN